MLVFYFFFSLPIYLFHVSPSLSLPHILAEDRVSTLDRFVFFEIALAEGALHIATTAEKKPGQSLLHIHWVVGAKNHMLAIFGTVSLRGRGGPRDAAV